MQLSRSCRSCGLVMFIMCDMAEIAIRSDVFDALLPILNCVVTASDYDVPTEVCSRFIW